jgi:2-polyprenyl-3-methyl-5-hydroxy-6-metoxy-1,4-benzoquinol methylase
MTKKAAAAKKVKPNERTARWNSKCRACGRAIPAGSQMEWTREGGPRHLSAAECEVAKLLPVAAKAAPTPPAVTETPIEHWTNFEKLGHLLQEAQWIFAKTMASNPHWYTLRKKWVNDADFVWVVERIRLCGYKQKFGGSWYVQLDVNDWFYWSMGAPLPITILVNRKRISKVAPYDAIADQYDALFQDEASLAEKAQVFGVVGDLTDREVLDVGCGTGRTLDYAERAAGYTGIDPSQAMLDRLRVRHPSAHTICTTLRSFAPVSNGEVGRYDTVLALFGTGSYLTDEELERIPLLLRSGGRAVVMFYDADYVPQTSITVPHRKWAPGLFPGEIQKVRHHIVCVYEKP